MGVGKFLFSLTLVAALLTPVTGALGSDSETPAIITRELDLGHTQRALDLLNKSFPELTPAKRCMLRAQVYGEAGQYERALLQLNQALKLSPNSNEILFTRMSLFRATGRSKDALADCNAQLSNGSYKIGRLRDRASIYCDLKEFDKAIADLKQASCIPGDNVYAALDGASLSKKLDRPRDLIAFASQVIGAMPKEATPYVMRAEGYLALAENAKALADLEMALKLEPFEKDSILELLKRCKNRQCIHNTTKRLEQVK